MLRILIADNNRELCETLSDYVNAQPDMQVVSFAYDGEEALAVIKEHQPDVVLLDVTMPHLDGMAVLERMYELEMAEPPRVIMITALGREDIIQHIAGLGADYYLIKPFDLDLLVERIRQFAASDGVGVPHKGRGEARRNAGLEDERGVTDLLQEIGVPAHFKGYAFPRRRSLDAAGPAPDWRFIDETAVSVVGREVRRHSRSGGGGHSKRHRRQLGAWESGAPSRVDRIELLSDQFGAHRLSERPCSLTKTSGRGPQLFVGALCATPLKRHSEDRRAKARQEEVNSPTGLFGWSGWRDPTTRPLRPERSALAKLSYTPPPASVR